MMYKLLDGSQAGDSQEDVSCDLRDEPLPMRINE